MNLTDHYPGGEDPFEGDRTLLLHSLPAGARVTKASVTLTPAHPADGTKFEETITFPNGQGNLGATKAKGTGFVEVDFHARRTLAKVAGTDIPGANLQVDMGGAYVDVNSRGAIGGTANDLFPVPADGVLPGLTVNKFKLRGTGNLEIKKVTIRSVPTNISVRLGQMPPFWTRVGELSKADTSPDFAAVFNAFLATIQSQDGFYTIPFTIHSDTIARLDVDVSIDFVIDQPVLPSHLPEVTLPYGFSTLPGINESLTTVKLPRNAMPVAGQSGAQVRGEFQPTRVAQGLVGEGPEFFPVEVSPECSLAQALQSNKEVEVIAVDLPLGKTQAGLAGLNIAIRDDDDGKPSSTVLVTADVRVDKPLPDQSTWGSATLATPFRISPGQRYWLVLQSQIGKAFWNATPGAAVKPAIKDPPLQCTRDGGLSWRVATTPDVIEPLTALLRLRDKPDHFTMPVQLQIGKGPAAVRRRLDEFAPLGRIEFAFDFAQKLQEHLAKPEVGISLCGSEELIENGHFELPPFDVATRRLFGFDHGTGVSLIGRVDLSQGVDLSVERYLYLSHGDGPVIRIDCSGRTPARTTLDEIVKAINRATRSFAAGQDVAQRDQQTGNRLVLQSPDQTSGGGQPLTLYFGATHAPPKGWQVVGAVQRVRWPPVIGTTSDEGAPAPAPIGGRIACALYAGSDAIDATTLRQQMAVTEGCTYGLHFLFQSDLQVGAVDFGIYASTITGPNPRIEREARFESWSSGTPPTLNAHTVINNWDQGNGLEVADGEMRIFVPPLMFVGLQLEVSGNVSLIAFNDDGSTAHSQLLTDGDNDDTIQMILLTGKSITQINLTAIGTTGETSNEALIHQFAYGRSPFPSALPDEWRALGREFGTPSSADAAFPRWEVIWLDKAGRQIRADGKDLDTVLTRNVDGLLTYETLLTAPAGATHADVRFAQPPQGLFLLGDVSFTPAVAALSNGAFREWTEQGGQLLPIGWTRNSGAIESAAISPGSQSFEGVRLKSGSADDSIIVQTASVKGGRGYGLTARAWLERPSGSSTTGASILTTAQRPRIELAWLDGTGKSIGQAVILALDEPGFPGFFWHGTAPESAVQVEIRLIQPRDGASHLVIGSLSFEGDDLVEVPLIFLGEAPGQLTLSNMHVTYDLPTPSQPQVRLARQRQTTAPQANTLAVGAVVEPAAPAAVAPHRLSLANSPMDIVSGLGPRFAKILRALSPPISTVAGLAALDPQIKIKGISAGRQLELKTAAEMISDIDLALLPTSTLAGETLDTLLALPPVELAQRGALSIEQAEQLQRKLRALRLLIKDDAFRRLRPSDLMAG